MWKIVVLIAALLLWPAVYAFAGGRTTPYGDYCTGCSAYGVGKDILSPNESVRALEKYYGEKGYAIGAVNYKGRFVEAQIYKNGRRVDSVLFDRKTGRLRSIY